MAKKLCMGCMEEYEDSFNVCPVCGYAEGTGPREAYHIMPGTVLQGKYIVGRSIGYGGFGITYIGYDYALGHKIAIKEYLPGEFSTRCMGDKKVTIFEGEKQEQFLSGIEKFVDEARRLAGFRDVDGVVTVYDSFKENNTAYIVMEYLEGRTLKEILQEKGKLDLEEAVAYIVPILDALSEIHKEGLLHRDISPDNIFVTNDGRVKLIDFGAARYATTTHSKSLSVIVKPGYAPQEQYRSRGDQGPWTDVYACAATLYKMITGITPEDSMERGDKDTLKEPRKAGARIPKNKQNAIMNALNLKVEDRTQTAEAFKEELLSDNWVQRRKNTLKKMDIGRWPLWVKISSGVGAAAVVTVLVLLLTGVIRFSFENGRLHFQIGEGNTLVPSVLNYAEAEAKEIVEQHNLVFSVGGEKESDEIAEGIVLDQGFRAGSEVPEDSVLFVYISKGRGKAEIKNYIGRAEDEVKRMLEEDSIPYITERGESEIAPGCIYEQSIEKGTSVEKGTDIKLMVSAGIAAYDKKKDTKVPKLVGKAFDEGRKAVRDSHLYIRVTSWKESNDIPEGQIIKQDKKAGTSVKEGEIVGVTVSLGIRKERVKDVTGEYIDDAIQILEKQGFRVRKETEKSDSVAKGYVIRQDPGADTETEVTKAGKPVEIVLWVSEGSEEMNGAVPNITGRVFDDVVKSILSEYGYRLGQITYKNGTSKSQDGRILEQSPAAGRIAAEGTAVDITVYRYVEAAAEDVTDDRVEVPNVTGKSLDAAKAILKEKELKGQVISWVNTDQEKLKDQVKAQDRTSGLVDRGTTIKLTVYKYVPKKGSDKKAEADVEKKKEEKQTEKKTEEQKKTVEMPNFINSDRTDAEKKINEIKNAGLNLQVNWKTEKGLDKNKANQVIAQSPVKGTALKKDTSIELTVYVCNGVVVPKVIGMTEQEAVQALKNSGLAVGKIEKHSNSAYPADTINQVISQGVAERSTVEEGTQISLDVCDNTTIDYYSYQSVSTTKKTTESSNSPGSGYTLVDTKTEKIEDGWGAWSDYTETSINNTSTREYDPTPRVKLQVGYWYGDGWRGYHKQAGYYSKEKTGWFWKDELGLVNTKYSNETNCYYDTYNAPDGDVYCHSSVYWSGEANYYRYRDKKYKTKTTYYWEKPTYSSWSSWSKNEVTKSSQRRVSKVTIYWDEDPNGCNPDNHVLP